MKALVTAARGSHLKPLTHTINKHLIPLANKPMIFYALEHIASAGIQDIGVVINENDTEIPQAVGNGSRWNAKIAYIKQTGGTFGLGHVIKVAREFLGDGKFLLYLGDNIIHDDLTVLIHDFEQSASNCLLTLAKVRNPERFGVPEFKDGNIIRVEERPIQPKSEYAVAGLYFYDQTAHIAAEHIKPSFRGDYEISDIHTYLAQNGYRVGWQEINSWWKDRGDARDLLEGNKFILSRLASKKQEAYIEPTVKIEGAIEIKQGTKIGGKTLIRGPVSIGEYCLIKDSYIGPFTSLGNKVELHGANIEHSLVFDDTSIVTPTKIIDSVIGAGTTISARHLEMPEGNKIIVGENSSLAI
ncbi:MAG: glucose-1-phosphate thymidylyltransferase [Candidatus Spechtbacteria bacterium]|nr:glucose-1-phosphate thymidylyltransferase [Candidatus Spechtbacteria bacterium]